VNHGLIFFDFEAATWNWDEDRIMRLEVSQDMVKHLVKSTLQDATHKDTVEILKFAACLGNREFNTLILSNVIGCPQEEVDPF
jgi:predicted ATPase